MIRFKDEFEDDNDGEYLYNSKKELLQFVFHKKLDITSGNYSDEKWFELRKLKDFEMFWFIRLSQATENQAMEEFYPYKQSQFAERFNMTKFQ